MAKLEKVFRDPDSQYRGKPFWAWNGKLESEELRRQIRIMYRMGLGGFFMHSRVGLGTAYLSDEWFEMVKACVDEADEMDMEAWMYDEDRWPSGAGGGFVTRDEDYAMKALELSIVPRKKYRAGKEKPLAVFYADLDDDRTISDPQKLKKRSKKKPSGDTVLVFKEVLQARSSWYNGERYLDTINHEAVQRFIEVSYESYAEPVGDAFGKTIPGVFTDEPNYGRVLNSNFTGEESKWETRYLPWTDKLPQVFKERYGYDIRNHLPELFFDDADEPVSQARWHYFDCITHLFADAFGRQIGEWCGEHDLLFTGHVLAEGTPSSQTGVVGSAMRFYEHMQAPGIDILRESNREYDTAKQCSSVAEQMGRRWVLSELYGCTGWQFPFESHKAVGDWQAALGINLRCQHLSWYTMAGQAKRDYPASIFFQSPWWEQYPTVEDYFSRVNVLISHGQAVRKLLVIHPIESTWVRMSLSNAAAQEIPELDRRLQTMRDWLLEAHLDFDYGDEEMLSRLGKVRRSRKYGPSVSLGKAKYEAVLVPPTVTLRSSTLELLQDFADAGGTVVFCDGVAGYVDAQPSEAARQLADQVKTVPFDKESVVWALENAARALSITGADGQEAASVLYNLREHKNARYLFICNTDREEGTGPLEVTLMEALEAELWDPETGERWCADMTKGEDRVTVRTELEASGSTCFVFKAACDKKLTPRPALKETESDAIKRKEWPIQLSDPNVLVLDRPAWKLRKRQWRDQTEVLKVDQLVRDALKIPRRGGQMKQPWAREKKEKKVTAPLKLRYIFGAETLPGGNIYLAAEQPERLCIAVNGYPVDTDAECGWWTDPAIRTVPIDPTYLRVGENEIDISTTFDEDSNLEAMFLLGQFGVEVDGTKVTMKDLPSRITLGNWVEQGLPFYSGAVSYITEIDRPKAKDARVFLKTPGFSGACVRVFVNERYAGTIGWRPYELDITDMLKDKKNTLVMQVFGTRRNSFGPLHHIELVSGWTGPGQFITEGPEWREDYHLHPCGLLMPPELTLKK